MNTLISTPDDFRLRGKTSGGLIVAALPALWTPDAGATGVIAVVRQTPLLAVVGGQVWQMGGGDTDAGSDGTFGRRRGEERPVTLGGIVIMSGSRHKEPTRVIGHPDLASGASVQRGDTLYVSVAEAIYRESRGEYVEVHLSPTADDNAALSDLRTRARHRWENDRLPDGWTRPLPTTPTPKEVHVSGSSRLSDDMRRLAEDIKARERGGKTKRG